ncbi:DoxX family protein [Leptospira wolffii]|uniref:DoxX family protein n=1 Tax=Leptospira wolffii TaxID=409998 RepID=A0A2M9ZBX8_9LEPT|nr:DoxX family protein [Leptospira wolffii]EPG65917.1 DoxX-like family protein [Leptospira wolffii serovar Khorat str. Khorat-H2]PJZ65837.1 DoxX-like family protein [Leptospira wolffii]TGK59449.1 DoxX-like family protein [Leptospira wolffii]TGK71168.1 DoxX-like family protein [Leptospira wolffii]TGK77736.1 DoxX-like family protein [Leptospira wolffii]
MVALTQTTKNRISTTLAVFSALVFIQTLFFKFTGASESVKIFSTLGIEPWGRIGTGSVEFIIATLLVFPASRFIGALVGFGLMVGAVLSHLLFLGIVVDDDGGLLFILAVLVLLSCITIINLEWDRRPPT